MFSWKTVQATFDTDGFRGYSKLDCLFSRCALGLGSEHYAGRSMLKGVCARGVAGVLVFGVERLVSAGDSVRPSALMVMGQTSINKDIAFLGPRPSA